MDAKLKVRAQQVAQLRNLRRKPTTAEINEVADVHHLLTGKTTNCNGCNVYGFIAEINNILIREPLIIKDMANAKGHFKQGAASTQIIRHGKNGMVVITPENINEGDNFEWAAKHYPHLVAESKSKSEETEVAKPAAKTKTEATSGTTKK